MTQEKFETHSIPVEVDLSKVIQTVGMASQQALVDAARARGQLQNIADLLRAFVDKWTEGSKEEGTPNETRQTATADLLMAQLQIQQISTHVIEALVHVHNAEAGRAEVQRTMQEVRENPAAFATRA